MNKFNLNIYHTSDTHGHLTSDSYSNQGMLPKGLARVSSFFKTQTQKHQIRIDLGDTIQGSPLAFLYHKSKKHDFHPFAKTINKMNYDFYVPGNHDFNYGLNYLNRFIDLLDAEVLCSNVYKDQELYFKHAYEIKSYLNGPKVAIIGLTNNYVPHWESEDHIPGLIFERAYENAKNIVEYIKKQEKPDFIVVAYHGGYECNIETGENEAKNKDENLGCEIFKNIKDVDLLLTGHEHRLLVLNEDNRVMLQPGFAGSHVSHTSIDFVFENSQWVIKNVQAKLVSMEDYKDDQEILDLLDHFLKEMDEDLDQVVGYTNQDLVIKDPLHARLEKHPVFQYINEVQMQTTNAMISCCGLGNDVTGFNKTITVRDVLNTYVYPNTLSLCEITGKNLKSALAHNAQFFIIDDQGEFDFNPKYLYPKKELYNYDVFDGISYEFHIYKDKNNEVENVTYKGKEVKDDDVLTIVLNSYRMSGGGNITWHEPLKVIQDYPLDITEVIIDDILKRKNISVEYQNNIKLIKHI